MSDLPAGWIDTQFADVADVQLGKMLDKAKNSGIPTPYLRNINVRWGEVDLSDVVTMPMSDSERSKFAIHDGDVLVCEGGEPGRASVWRLGPTDLKFQKAILRVRAAEGISPDWLAQYLWLSARDGTLEGRFTGTTIKHLPREALQNTRLPLPPEREQRRIITKIDSLSGKSKRARDHLDHVPRLVEKYKKAILKAAFVGILVPNRQSDWTESSIEEICTLIDGDRGPKYPKKSDYQTAGHCLFLSTKNVRPDGFDFSETIYIGKQKHEELRKGTLARGDLVITTRGTIGNVAFYDDMVPHDVVRINSGMLILRRKTGAVMGEYLKYFIMSPLFTDEIERQTTGSAQPQLPAGILKRFPVRYPSIAQQDNIVHRVESAFAWIDRLASEATSARKLIDHLDQAILAKAFRGELVLQDPNDEPASVLLTKIKEESGAPLRNSRGRRKSVDQRADLATAVA